MCKRLLSAKVGKNFQFQRICDVFFVFLSKIPHSKFEKLGVKYK